jgi:hypothetical protein
MTLTYCYNKKHEILDIFEIINPGFFTETFREIEVGIYLPKNEYEKYKEMLDSDDNTITAIAIKIIKNKFINNDNNMLL